MNNSIRLKTSIVLILTVFQFSCGDHPKECFIENGGLTMNNARLPDILDKLSIYYKIGICNPQNVEGETLTGKVTLFTSLLQVVNAIEASENGKAYLHYEDGIIYVAQAPFPDNFTPDAIKWPCH
jgi:hypothetical protein